MAIATMLKEVVSQSIPFSSQDWWILKVVIASQSQRGRRTTNPRRRGNQNQKPKGLRFSRKCFGHLCQAVVRRWWARPELWEAFTRVPHWEAFTRVPHWEAPHQKWPLGGFGQGPPLGKFRRPLKVRSERPPEKHLQNKTFITRSGLWEALGRAPSLGRFRKPLKVRSERPHQITEL